jgi:hypothetical protein
MNDDDVNERDRDRLEQGLKNMECSMLRLQLEEIEHKVLQDKATFRNIMAHVRCGICGDQIDDTRWMLGEVGETQEIVHATCHYDEPAEEQAEEENADNYKTYGMYHGTPIEKDAEIEGVGSDERGYGGIGSQHDVEGSGKTANVLGHGAVDSRSVSSGVEKEIPFIGENDVTVRVPPWLKKVVRDEVTWDRGTADALEREREAIEKIGRALEGRI